MGGGGDDDDDDDDDDVAAADDLITMRGRAQQLFTIIIAASPILFCGSF